MKGARSRAFQRSEPARVPPRGVARHLPPEGRPERSLESPSAPDLWILALRRAAGCRVSAFLAGSLLALSSPDEAVGDEGDDAPDSEEEVEVSAPSPEDSGPDPADTSAAVTLIRPDDPTLAPGADLGDALGGVPGVRVRRLGGLGDYSTATIRGSTARQVEVFLDGIPLNPDGLGVVNLSELPLTGLDRVEVYRGNAPAWLGASAMGGVIHLVTSGADLPRPRLLASYGSLLTRKVHASMSTRLGSFGEARVSVDSFGTRGDFSFFDDRETTSNLFDDRTVTRQNNEKQDLSVLARGRFKAGTWTFSLQDGFYVRDEGVPGSAHSQTLHTHLATLRNLIHASAGAPLHRGGRVDLRLHHHFREERYQDPEGEVGIGVQDTRDRYHDLGGSVRLRLLPVTFLGLDASGAIRSDLFQPYSFMETPSTDGWRVRMTARLSVEASLALWGDRIRIAPVLEGRLVDDRFLGEIPFSTLAVNEGEDLFRTPFTPRLGVRFRPVAPLTVKANAGRYLRLPDFTEIYGDRGSIVGNDSLVPESGTSLDLGVRVEGRPGRVIPHFSIEVTGFATYSQDLIAYVLNGQQVAMAVNLRGARVLGVEGGGSLSLGRWLELGADLTWVDSRIGAEEEAYNGNQIPGLPTWEGSIKMALLLPVVRLGYDVSLTAGTFRDATNWYLDPPRLLHGAHLKLQPRPSWPWLAVEVRNLTDERVAVVPRNPLDPENEDRIVRALTDFGGHPLPGRTFLVTLGFTPPEPSSSARKKAISGENLQ